MTKINTSWVHNTQMPSLEGMPFKAATLKEKNLRTRNVSLWHAMPPTISLSIQNEKFTRKMPNSIMDGFFHWGIKVTNHYEKRLIKR